MYSATKDTIPKNNMRAGVCVCGGCVSVYVCTYVCVCGKEREEGGGERGREKKE